MTPNTAAGLAARVEELTAEVEYLRGELGMMRDAARVGAMKTDLKLTTQEAAVCDALMTKAPGVTFPKLALFEAAWFPRAEEVEMKILDVFICKIRRKLGFDAIETVWGSGYRLTDSGRALLTGASA